MAYSIHYKATPGKVKHPAAPVIPAPGDVTETDDVTRQDREVKHATAGRGWAWQFQQTTYSAGRQLATGRTIYLHSIRPSQFNCTCS